MTSLTFNAPQLLSDHFIVSPDLTHWTRSYVKTPHGTTPQRDRASFQKIGGVLQPETDLAFELDHTTGLYLLAFDLPEPSLYVGIAAEGKSPEGIARRVRKHSVKSMGSHVGSVNSTGGVHHPAKWRNFAISRHEHFDGGQDVLSDVRFAYASASGGNNKATLQNFERLICSNARGVLDQICSALWPGSGANGVLLLTSGTVRVQGEFDYLINLWE
jgi:hypothetical protein